MKALILGLLLPILSWAEPVHITGLWAKVNGLYEAYSIHYVNAYSNTEVASLQQKEYTCRKVGSYSQCKKINSKNVAVPYPLMQKMWLQAFKEVIFENVQSPYSVTENTESIREWQKQQGSRIGNAMFNTVIWRETSNGTKKFILGRSQQSSVGMPEFVYWGQGQWGQMVSVSMENNKERYVYSALVMFKQLRR